MRAALIDASCAKDFKKDQINRENIITGRYLPQTMPKPKLSITETDCKSISLTFPA